MNRTYFRQSPNGDVFAEFGSLLLGVWFTHKQEGTFRHAAGGTGKVNDMTAWITLMQSLR